MFNHRDEVKIGQNIIMFSIPRKDMTLFEQEEEQKLDDHSGHENGLEIIFEKTIREHSLFSLHLPLPLEIKLCEMNLFNFFYYFLLGLGGVFFFVAITSIYMIYK